VGNESFNRFLGDVVYAITNPDFKPGCSKTSPKMGGYHARAPRIKKMYRDAI